MKKISPNIEIMLRIYLSMKVTNCSGERSFSKLKLIKTRLRSIMGNQLSNNLAVLSIEHYILKQTDFSQLISNFVTRKSYWVYKYMSSPVLCMAITYSLDSWFVIIFQKEHIQIKINWVMYSLYSIMLTCQR